MANKVFGQDFTDTTSIDGAETISVLKSGALKDASLANIISGSVNNATSKATPVDADKVGVVDSEASNVLKSLSWSNLKATLKTYFDTLYTGGGDGWTSSSATWSYSSADSPTFIASVNADLTSLVSKGMRVSLQQTQALTAYWTFNSSSAADVGTYTMTDTNMTYTSGLFSNAATFNGASSKIVITDTASLKPTGDFTIGFRVKTTSTGAGIFQSWNATPSFGGISIQVFSSAVRVLVAKNTGTTQDVDYSVVDGTTNIADNSWHYIVVTFRNNYLQIYVDGNLEKGRWVFAPAYVATNYIRIGCYDSGGVDSLFFSGQIDDMFVINGYALDGKTILDKYRAATAQGTSNITLTKYFIVTDVGAYSGSATLITMYGGTDHALANATITSPKYSLVKCPFGFDPNPIKWSTVLTDMADRTQSSPAALTWYNPGSLSLTVPIGAWRFELVCLAAATDNTSSVTNVRFCVSTANNTSSDAEMFGQVTAASGTAGTIYALSTAMLGKYLTVKTKTTYYVNIATAFASVESITFFNSTATLNLRAICAYL